MREDAEVDCGCNLPVDLRNFARREDLFVDIGKKQHGIEDCLALYRKRLYAVDKAVRVNLLLGADYVTFGDFLGVFAAGEIAGCSEEVKGASCIPVFLRRECRTARDNPFFESAVNEIIFT